MTILIILVSVAAVIYISQSGVFGKKQQTTVTGGQPLPTPAAVGICSQACPTNLAWAGTANVQNTLNKTGVETYDNTMYFFDTADGSLKTSITDTTSGSVSLTCGHQYKVQVTSTSGGAGADSQLISSSIGQADGSGNIILPACGDGQVFTVNANQHGLWDTRAFDVINNAYLFDGNGIAGAANFTATAYKTLTPTNFTSTTNGTQMAIGAGGEIHIIQTIRATNGDENLNDRGIYVLIDANTNKWKVPTVKIDGSATPATNIKGSLNSDESAAYSAYEYVYKIDGSRAITNTNPINIDIDMFALDGTNPVTTDSPLVDYAPIGQYVSTNQNNVIKVSSVKDDSSHTAVHTLEQTIYSIS